jgi:hypothetical protein
MAKKRKPKPKELPPFNMFTWSSRIPLVDDDLWLGMQARNLAMVDIQVIRHVETAAVREYFRDERTPMPTLMLLSALSQMWIFALYELLRTWRERAKHLIKLADEYETVQARKRQKFLEQVIANAKNKEKHIRIPISVLSEHVSRIADKPFMDKVREYFSKIDGLFSEIEALRVTLAKHQIQGSSRFVAEAPGYARMSYETGSLYWHYLAKEGGLERSERREIADLFFEIGTTFSELDLTENDEPESEG